MRKLLTDLTLQQLKYGDKTTTYWDTKLPSFGVRVGKHTKTFVVLQGKDRRLSTIGHYPESSLQEAKKKAKLVLVTDPKVERMAYQEAVEAFIGAMSGRLKPATVHQYKSYLDTFAFPSLEMSKAEIGGKLHQHWKGKPWAQNYAYAALRCFLNWCLDQEFIDKHPLIRGKPPNKTKSRERVLSDEELGSVWRCTEDNTYGRIIRLLILTGQRRMEVKNLTEKDVADGTITFHTKGDKINVLPVTPLVQENLVLPFQFNNWGDAKARFDADCGVDFRHHDLRRTLATNLARFGVPVVVIERILGHAPQKLVATYQRYEYAKEIKDALLLYEAHIRSLAAKGVN